MEIARTHSHGDVSNGTRRVESFVHWRPRAIYADLRGALCGAGEGMGVIQVQEPGLFTTVQDLRREGFGPFGVSASVAADAVSLRIGNRLVGNAEGAAGLEMTLLGGTFLFPEGAVGALEGFDFGARLGGKRVGWGSGVEMGWGGRRR